MLRDGVVSSFDNLPVSQVCVQEYAFSCFTFSSVTGWALLLATKALYGAQNCPKTEAKPSQDPPTLQRGYPSPLICHFDPDLEPCAHRKICTKMMLQFVQSFTDCRHDRGNFLWQ